MKSNVTIAVLAYNEEQAIRGVLESLLQRYPEHELLVVNDGSKDRTAEIVRQTGARLITHKSNRGYGAAWKSALRHAHTDIIVFFDGDGQFDVADVSRVIDTFLKEDADMVVGERGRDSHVPLFRRPGKRLITLLASFLIGRRIKDPNCGLRAVKRKVLLHYVRLLPDGFSASTTSLLLFLKRGYNVVFEPVVVKERLGSSSVRQIRDGFGTIVLMTRMIALFNPLRIFLPISLLMLGVSIAYSTFEVISRGLGVPVLGATIFIGGILAFLMGVLSDQISAIRLNQLGDPIVEADDAIVE